MKAFRYILFSLLIAAAAGYLGYLFFVTGQAEPRDVIRASLIICGAIISMIRPPKRKIINKKTVYQKAYSEYIQNAFYDQPKLEKRFYDAVHDYNQNRAGSAIAKLEKLRKECQRSSDLYAVTVFTALSLDEQQLYEKALAQYQAALSIRSSSSLQSNMGLCYQRLGNFEEAERCYERAIQLNPKNAFVYNNISALNFRRGNYDQALDDAVEAIRIDGKMRQALTTAAICSGLLGYTEDYEQYYRQAVINGADGSKIKEIIKNLDPEL